MPYRGKRSRRAGHLRTLAADARRYAVHEREDAARAATWPADGAGLTEAQLCIARPHRPGRLRRAQARDRHARGPPGGGGDGL